MPGKRIAEGERVFVDLTAPLSTLFFPVLELIIITGVCWMGVGYLDRLPGLDGSSPAAAFPVGTREALLWLWVLLSTWRFLIPLVRRRRQRLTVTDRRVLIRSPGLRSRYDSIPLSHMQGVRRRRGTLYLGLGGQERPYVVPEVPKARKVESILSDLLYR
ncbi:PH domain-containing protein [Corynebacterium pacaense]|uniref:PH domain-containing protein n=1 Tax=Corynebacterium pacaense TaxID=1816684 RepID=UPI0009BA78A3|nr:PH domain-containing protein [Corynebacterium pacaense]